VQGLRLQAVGDLLGTGEVVDLDKGVVEELVADVQASQP
jgi:hypothetical protein